MRRKVYHTLKTGMLLSLSLFACFSCTDTWDDHYDANKSITSDETLWQQICKNTNLSDFKEVLQATKTFRKHDKTTVSYADILDADQTYTVWAPVNGTFNKDSLLNLCETANGDSLVEKTFVKSHIARYIHSTAASVNKRVILLNGKKVSLNGTSFANTEIETSNAVAKNGVLHVVNAAVTYPYTIYEYINSFDDLSSLGNYYQAYHKEELDENASVVEGVNEDGLTVYVDSVMREYNELFNYLGLINAEDSTYWMIAPTNAGWEKAYAEAKNYFNFGNVNKADSLCNFYSRYLLLADAIFNYNEQRSVEDSLTSIKYSRFYPDESVFYRPFDAGGILSDYIEKVECSNGVLYKTEEWPFDIYSTYFKTVRVEGEYASYGGNYLKESTLCTYKVEEASGDSISSGSFLSILPEKSTSQWTLDLYARNVLSGTYDIYVVMLPKTVNNLNNTDFKPTKFKAWAYATDESGKVIETAFPNTYENDPYKVDSVFVGTVSFPTCSYGQDKAVASVKIKCTVGTKEITKYTRNVYLDCICLLPHKE